VLSAVLKILQELGLAPRDFIAASVLDVLPTTLMMLLVNLIAIVWLLGILRKQGREARRQSQASQGALAQAGAGD